MHSSTQEPKLHIIRRASELQRSKCAGVRPGGQCNWAFANPPKLVTRFHFLFSYNVLSNFVKTSLAQIGFVKVGMYPKNISKL